MGCNCGNTIKAERQVLPEFTSTGCPNIPTHDLFTEYSDAEKQIIAEQLGFLADTINIQNNPDEEDLTNIPGNTSPILKFKDKVYDPDNFSGYGRVFLRKNLVQITDINDSNYQNKTINVLTQNMFESESGCPLVNTIFVIQYDYDLHGTCIELPEESVLLFLGGSISNGVIILHNTSIINNFLNFEEVFPAITFNNHFKIGTTRLINNTLYYYSGSKWLPLFVEGSKDCNTEYTFYYGTANSYADIETSHNIKSFNSTIQYIKPIRFDTGIEEEPDIVRPTRIVADNPPTVILSQKYYWIVPVIDGYDISIYTDGIRNTEFRLVANKTIKSITYNVYEFASDMNTFDSQIFYIKK